MSVCLSDEDSTADSCDDDDTKLVIEESAMTSDTADDAVSSAVTDSQISGDNGAQCQQLTSETVGQGEVYSENDDALQIASSTTTFSYRKSSPEHSNHKPKGTGDLHSISYIRYCLYLWQCDP